MTSFHIYEDKESQAAGLADWISGNINTELKEKPRYSFCLSGGETPRHLYQILAKEYKTRVAWDRVDFFWGDERYVPFTDDRNNAKMAYENLLNPLAVPKENIFPISTVDLADKEAMNYQTILKKYFTDKNHTFDFTLLGMGGDAHTLSLFPGADLVLHHEGWVSEAFNDKENLKRITLLPEVVNHSKNIAFLVQGAGKADALHQVLEGNREPSLYPAQLIHAEGGKLLWFADMAAIEKLQGFSFFK